MVMNARDRLSPWCNRAALLTLALWYALPGLHTQAHAEGGLDGLSSFGKPIVRARKTMSEDFC